jgi:hypothetical protein
VIPVGRIVIDVGRQWAWIFVACTARSKTMTMNVETRDQLIMKRRTPGTVMVLEGDGEMPGDGEATAGGGGENTTCCGVGFPARKTCDRLLDERFSSGQSLRIVMALVSVDCLPPQKMILPSQIPLVNVAKAGNR